MITTQRHRSSTVWRFSSHFLCFCCVQRILQIIGGSYVESNATHSKAKWELNWFFSCRCIFCWEKWRIWVVWCFVKWWSCLWGIWTRALSSAMTSQCIRSQSLALSSRCGSDCCCSSMLSSNNCHSHSGFSRMSRQKAWRTCQRPQGFDSCMHKTLARFRSQQETAQDILYDIIST